MQPVHKSDDPCRGEPIYRYKKTRPRGKIPKCVIRGQNGARTAPRPFRMAYPSVCSRAPRILLPPAVMPRRDGGSLLAPTPLSALVAPIFSPPGERWGRLGRRPSRWGFGDTPSSPLPLRRGLRPSRAAPAGLLCRIVTTVIGCYGINNNWYPYRYFSRQSEVSGGLEPLSGMPKSRF